MFVNIAKVPPSANGVRWESSGAHNEPLNQFGFGGVTESGGESKLGRPSSTKLAAGDVGEKKDLRLFSSASNVPSRSSQRLQSNQRLTSNTREFSRESTRNENLRAGNWWLRGANANDNAGWTSDDECGFNLNKDLVVEEAKGTKNVDAVDVDDDAGYIFDYDYFASKDFDLLVAKARLAPLKQTLQRRLDDVQGRMEQILPAMTMTPNGVVDLAEAVQDEMRRAFQAHSRNPGSWQPRQCSLQMTDTFIPTLPPAESLHGVSYAVYITPHLIRVLRGEFFRGKATPIVSENSTTWRELGVHSPALHRLHFFDKIAMYIRKSLEDHNDIQRFANFACQAHPWPANSEGLDGMPNLSTSSLSPPTDGGTQTTRATELPRSHAPDHLPAKPPSSPIPGSPAPLGSGWNSVGNNNGGIQFGRSIPGRAASGSRTFCEASEYPLCVCFAFPMLQQSLRSATLLTWTDGIETGRAATSPVEGSDVCAELQSALERLEVPCTVVAHASETSAALYASCCEYLATNVTGPHEQRECICVVAVGEGVEAAVYQPLARAHHGYQGRIVELGLGHLNIGLPMMFVDHDLDYRDAATQGRHPFEKMLGSRYLGELARRLFIAIRQHRAPPAAWQELSLRGDHVLTIVDDNKITRTATKKILSQIWMSADVATTVPSWKQTTLREDTKLNELSLNADILFRCCWAVVDRAAGLIAGVLLGIVRLSAPARLAGVGSFLRNRLRHKRLGLCLTGPHFSSTTFRERTKIWVHQGIAGSLNRKDRSSSLRGGNGAPLYESTPTQGWGGGGGSVHSSPSVRQPAGTTLPGLDVVHVSATAIHGLVVIAGSLAADAQGFFGVPPDNPVEPCDFGGGDQAGRKWTRQNSTSSTESRGYYREGSPARGYQTLRQTSRFRRIYAEDARGGSGAKTQRPSVVWKKQMVDDRSPRSRANSGTSSEAVRAPGQSPRRNLNPAEGGRHTHRNRPIAK